MLFSFGEEVPSEEWTLVQPSDLYVPERGYGFEDPVALEPFAWKGAGPWNGGLLASSSLVFSKALPEGNYSVTVWLAGLPKMSSPVTIRSESRRLMMEALSPEEQDVLRYRFTVNVRRPDLKSGGRVELKDREEGTWHWDDRLQLEFSGETIALLGIEITPNPDAITVYLAGDSTVTDQVEEPWTGWGQMLPRFFDASVAVANHAESGEALRSFRAAGRFEKILDTIRPGDYLFIQFGHNDQKERGEGIGAFTSYADDLRDYVRKVREKGADPVLVTSMKRRRFDSEGRQYATLDDYPVAVRKVAAELRVPLIDLHLMSGVLYSALGPEGSKLAFVHYPAGTFPGQLEALRDDSHFSPYGGYQLARCIVLGIQLNLPDLADRLREDVGVYDPARPDPFSDFSLPPSSRASIQVPDGN
ncbi:MAG: rhamnogalacturonan acetylesterase [Opitutales bacterium]|nr:rhamnogalacturonan acetylesterase [Opitutales bacterium]